MLHETYSDAIDYAARKSAETRGTYTVIEDEGKFRSVNGVDRRYVAMFVNGKAPTTKRGAIDHPEGWHIIEA